MNPVAVVTGGAKRLGGHLSEALGARGCDVVIFYRTSSDEAHALARRIEGSGRRARALQVDVAVEGQVATAFADVARVEGRVDVLVNNVGNYHPLHVTKLTPAAWDASMAANLSGAYYCCFHALKLMKPGANIINIGTAGLDGLRAEVHGTDYYVTKTGLLVLTRALAAAYAAQQVRVNMVSPGQLENSVDLPPLHTLPLQRAGTLSDVSQAVAYLLDAGYVTGANLDVAGGYRL